MKTRAKYPRPVARQRGTVLVVAIVLLLLASIVSVLALNVGVFEQRASGNDVRAKLVQQVAESALSQGTEAILANTALLQSGYGTTWVQCAADDTSFPCGAVPATRRASMYRYNAGTADIFGGGGADTMEQRMLPLDRRYARVNDSAANTTDGFTVNYGVGAVLCRVVPQALTATGATCTTTVSQAVNVYAITLVAVADMGVEGARATAVKSFGTNSTFSLGADQPPIMASGTVDITGTFDAVTSANGGGPGVPVTIWTRKGIAGQGTPDTCYADEFYRSGTPTWYPNSTSDDKILRCDSCDCSVAQLTKRQGQTCTGGRDILAASGATDCSESNYVVQPQDFPCDMFQHIFGVKARSDSNNDYFCETLITASNPKPPGGVAGVDELYLGEKADWVVSATTAGTFGARFAGDARLVTCAQALAKTGALIWIRDSTCTITGTVGSPDGPVLIVYDGDAHINNGTIFGLLFVRSTGTAALDPATGGNASLQANGGVALYGGVAVQGTADKLNGTGAIIHNPDILEGIKDNLSVLDVLGLPGSWSDSVRY